MIVIHANLICTIRDGHTGKYLEPGQIQCRIDGAPCRPVVKKDGYWVFANVPPGVHRLTVTGRYYQPAWVSFTGDGAPQQCHLVLKPNLDYPYGQHVTTLTLRGLPPDSLEPVWLATLEVARLAQTQAEPGTVRLRVFCLTRGELPLPAVYLLGQGETAELLHLRRQTGEIVETVQPLRYSHVRGETLRTADCYYGDKTGQILAVFRKPCSVDVICGLNRLHLDLTEGENCCSLL